MDQVRKGGVQACVRNRGVGGSAASPTWFPGHVSTLRCPPAVHRKYCRQREDGVRSCVSDGDLPQHRGCAGAGSTGAAACCWGARCTGAEPSDTRGQETSCAGRQPACPALSWPAGQPMAAVTRPPWQRTERRQLVDQSGNRPSTRPVQMGSQQRHDDVGYAQSCTRGLPLVSWSPDTNQALLHQAQGLSLLRLLQPLRVSYLVLGVVHLPRWARPELQGAPATPAPVEHVAVGAGHRPGSRFPGDARRQRSETERGNAIKKKLFWGRVLHR